MSIQDYNEMTPHELNLHIEAFGERRNEESESILINAYMAAYWHRVKKMPSIKEVLKKPNQKKQRDQTPAEMLEMVKKLNAALGGGTSG